MDATDPFRPHNLLPKRALNHVGFLIEKDTFQWINVGSPSQSNQRSSVYATLQSDGSLEGELRVTSSGFAALGIRKYLDENEAADLLSDRILYMFPNATFENIEIENTEPTTKPIQIKSSFIIPQFANVAGDFMYVNLMLMDVLEENPFKLKDRTFPVDYAYIMESSLSMQITLPEGYAVQEQPKNIGIMTPGQEGQFRRMVQVNGQTLVFLNKLSRTKVTVEPAEYEGLKEFFDLVVAAHAEQLVLKNIGVIATDIK